MGTRNRLFRVLVSMLAIILPNVGLGDEFAIVQPSEYATKESPGASNGAFVWSNGYRMQLAIDVRVFKDLGGYPADLMAQVFRPDGDWDHPTTWEFPDRTMTFGIYDGPLSLSHDFDDNLAAIENAIVVYEGPLVQTTSNSMTSDGTKEFDVRCDFQVPFEYDSSGHLFYELIDNAPAPVTSYDLVTATDAVSWAWDGNAQSTYATSIGTGFPVTKWIFDILPGDLDNDKQLTLTDLSALKFEIGRGSSARRFDVNSDGTVDVLDRTHWVKGLKNTWFGDADLDGKFNSSDMVQVFAAGKYETGEDAGWANGDWNGDGVFASSDMVTAFVDGGYEQGDAVAVPELGGWLFLSLGVASLLAMRQRNRTELP